MGKIPHQDVSTLVSEGEPRQQETLQNRVRTILQRVWCGALNVVGLVFVLCNGVCRTGTFPYLADVS